MRRPRLGEHLAPAGLLGVIAVCCGAHLLALVATGIAAGLLGLVAR